MFALPPRNAITPRDSCIATGGPRGCKTLCFRLTKTRRLGLIVAPVPAFTKDQENNDQTTQSHHRGLPKEETTQAYCVSQGGSAPQVFHLGTDLQAAQQAHHRPD